jgi:hypothetical protein
MCCGKDGRKNMETAEMIHQLEISSEDVDESTKHAIVELATVRIEEMVNRLFNMAKLLE